MYTGVYTLTRDGSSDSSLHAKGWEGTAYGYTLDKTETGYEDSTTKGNRYLGFYTLDGTYGSTSTAIETLVHGSYGSTFTEILTEDGTASGAGNNNSGDYARHDWGDRSADFEQYGANADGDYHVTAGNVETFDRREIGNAGTGGYSLRETTDTDYSFTQVVDGTETWTLTGNGNDTMTAIEIGNRISSVYILNETGTDGYTLTETGTLSGGIVDQTVIGTYEYDTSWEGNHAQASYERETIGGGTWTRTGTNADNGTNGYTLELTGDEIAGHFSASTSGTNRYDLVERFSDISNTEPGVTTPGNVSFHSHGLPFRDPPPYVDPPPYAEYLRDMGVDPYGDDYSRNPIPLRPPNSQPIPQDPHFGALLLAFDGKTKWPPDIKVVEAVPTYPTVTGTKNLNNLSSLTPADIRALKGSDGATVEEFGPKYHDRGMPRSGTPRIEYEKRNFGSDPVGKVVVVTIPELRKKFVFERVISQSQIKEYGEKFPVTIPVDHGYYRLAAITPSTYSSEASYKEVRDKRILAGLQKLEFDLTAMLYIVPFGAASDSFAEGRSIEGTTLAAGDAAALGMGSKIRAIRLLSMTVEGGVIAYRGKQLINGEVGPEVYGELTLRVLFLSNGARRIGIFNSSGKEVRLQGVAPTRLTPEQVRAVENARQIARGDCEQAAEVLRKTLPGGTKQRFAGERLLHEAYQHQGTVYDVTAKQYVRPGVWTQEELARAGLADAVESGVFTPQQHQTFMQKVIQVFGGVAD